MPVIETDRLKTSYHTVGEGPDLIMVHGLAANMAFWFFDSMPALAKQFRVTVYDLRGHGLSALPASGYTTRDLAEDLLALMDSLQIEQAHLAGHSLGGATCLHAAALQPQRVLSMTLMECRLHALQPIKSRDNEAFWEKHGPEFAEQGIIIPKQTPKILYSMMRELEPLAEIGKVNPNSVPGLISRKTIWDPKSRAAKRWLRLVSETTFAPDIQSVAGLTEEVISGIQTPARIVFGGDSPFMPTCDALGGLLAHQQTTVLPGRGHFFPIHEPETVISEVSRCRELVA